MILSNDGFVAFHYRYYGAFFYTKIGSIRSIGGLPTTNIIEPINLLIYTINYALQKLILILILVKLKKMQNLFLE
ncbi:hypothetical protein CYK13_01395 [Streptococcus anginosus]|nr:hypothetical protein F6I00_00005 [Streptococcus anginosus]OHO36484.1 hypothetical protein HMPREF2574_05425 [Streptococcus sp. HMSC034E12]PLA02857.1 hypothetical protein CYK12_01395 [Streptococcus anginosus]PLA06695.1 hypothetical protein CYK09_01840 [Streptococcus anginosus]PLA59178.1 hypothetical protein CYK15_01395 [Streptococcus anginosus]